MFTCRDLANRFRYAKEQIHYITERVEEKDIQIAELDPNITKDYEKEKKTLEKLRDRLDGQKIHFTKEFSKRYILIRNGVRRDIGRIVRIGRVQIIGGALVNAITFVKQDIDEPEQSVTENIYVQIPDDPEVDIEIFEEIDDAADLTDAIIDSDDDDDNVEFGGGKSKRRSYKKKSNKRKSKKKSKRKMRKIKNN
jgi:hypothetical protein